MVRKWTLWIGSVLLAFACKGVEPQNTSPALVAEFNPEPVSLSETELVLPAVPAPSDLLRDPTSGRVAIPLEYRLTVLGKEDPVVVPAFSTPAARTFVESYLNSLYGFIPGSTTEFSVSGSVDPETVGPESLLVLDITDLLNGVEVPEVTAVEDVTYHVSTQDPERTHIVIAPPIAGWTQGRTYLFVATSGILGTDGSPLVSSYIFDLLKSVAPLAREGASLCALPDESAASLETVRLALEPLFLFLQNAPAPLNIERKDVAVLWTLTIQPESLAVNDPSTGQVPTPSDLLYTSPVASQHDCDQDGNPDCVQGHLCLPLDCEADSPAQIAFSNYMNSLDGWPASLAVTSRFSLPVDPETLTGDAVGLYRLDGEAPQRIDAVNTSLSLDNTLLTLQAADGFEAGARYAVVLGRAFKTAGGTYPIAPSQVTALALLTDPLVDDQGNSNLLDLGVPTELAGQLEFIRQWIAGVILALDLGSIRETIASVWSFTIQSGNEAMFDTIAGIIPMPNDLLMTLDEDGNPVQVALPIDPAWSPVQQALVAELNLLDGFSPLGRITTSFLRPLNPDSFVWLESIATTDLVNIYFNGKDATGLGDISVALLDVTEVDPSAGIMGLAALLDPANIFDATEMEATFSSGKLVLTPKTSTPLPEGHRFMALAFTTLQSEENDPQGTPFPIHVAPTFFFARTEHPLVDETGHSLVSTLSDADATMLEMLRGNYGPIFDALSNIGVAREEVAMFWTFTTQTISQWLDGLATEVVAATETTVQVVTEGSLTLPEDASVDVPLTHAAQIVEDGRFTAWNGLTAANFSQEAYDAGHFTKNDDGEIVLQKGTLPFVLVLPEETAEITAPFPVAVMIHGFYGDRYAMLVHADAFLEKGYAVLTTDLPFHGLRTVTGEEPGTGYLGADVLADRDHFAQAVLDVLQLIHLAASQDGLNAWLETQLGVPGVLDVSRIHVVANSLGAIAAIPAVALSNEVTSAGFVAVGGHLTRVLSETKAGWLQAPIIAGLAELGVLPGTADFVDFLGFSQQILDRVDPIYFAKRLAASPLTGRSAKPVLFIQSTDDEVFPAATSQGLQCAARSGQDTWTLELEGMCHGFLVSPCGEDESLAPEAYQAAGALVQFFESSGDGSTIAGAVSGADLNCDAE